MNVLLAAIDDSAAARPVLAVARRLASFVDADVVAVHVLEGESGATARAIADACDVPVHLRRGDVATELCEAARDLHALAVVLGARRVPSGASPAGHVALRVVQQLARAVVVVPPDACDRPLRRALVAVAGDGESVAVATVAARLGDRPGPEIVALHVFEPDSLPPFGDAPVHETEAWSREFLRRIAGTPLDRVRLEIRVGDAPSVMREAIDELDVDLVALGWHRDLSPGHGRLVRDVLASSPVPVLLLPIARDAPTRPRQPSASA